ncbi:MAG: DUF4402 domain-containing protein [Telluria sp.]
MTARCAFLLYGLLQAFAPARAQLPPIAPPDLTPGGPVEPPEDPLAGPHFVRISTTRSLAFGRFVAGTGGTITVTPAGGRSRTGGVILLNSAGGANATFSVTRSGKAATSSVILSFPVNGSVSLSNGQQTMPVRNFVNGSGSILPAGASSNALTIGATLTVAPNQAPGQYSGNFIMTVNYQ